MARRTSHITPIYHLLYQLQNQHKMNQHKTITATSKGVAVNYQDSGKSSFIPYEQTAFESTRSHVGQNILILNDIQRNMYRKLMYGMKNYTSEQIETMPQTMIFQIEKDHMRATNVINKLKYQRVYGAYNKLLSVIFPHVELDYYTDGKYVSLPSLRELKISTRNIIDAWIENKLLPLNFYNLTIDTIKL